MHGWVANDGVGGSPVGVRFWLLCLARAAMWTFPVLKGGICVSLESVVCAFYFLKDILRELAIMERAVLDANSFIYLLPVFWIKFSIHLCYPLRKS